MTLTSNPETDPSAPPTPRILVAFASRHGSTEEIARAIGDELTAAGITVDVRPVGDVDSLDGYDATIIGSAVYVGRWLADARQFVEHRIVDLCRRPVWLFSSGPVDDSVNPADVPPVRSVEAVARRIGARGHATFGGRVGPEMNGPMERWVLRGDWRDFGAIRLWARAIAEDITATVAA
jgi:menaquinone-dependent protoporphyrinogen oxidase